MICDFCNDPDPPHELQCADFSVLAWGSRGSWMACDRCLEVVATQDLDQLTEYALRRYYEKHPDEPPCAELGPYLREHYRLFFANRIQPTT